MAIIKKKFTYDLPDEYLAQTKDLGLTGEWEYEGPNKVYVHVDKKTNVILPQCSCQAHDDERTQEENDHIMDVYTGLDAYHAPIEFDKDPVLLSCLFPRLASDMPQKEYTHPVTGEVFYSRPDPIMPDHTIQIEQVEYDFDKKEWKKPYPMRQPHITRDQFEAAYNGILSNYKVTPTENYTSAQKKKWSDFVKEFEAVPTKFADYMDTPWMVPFPSDPRMDEKWGVENDGLISETPITENPDAAPSAVVVEETPVKDLSGYDVEALAEAELTDEEKVSEETPERFKVGVSTT
jgi:hypothetical protein